MRTLSGVRRRVDRLLRVTACTLPHVVERFRWLSPQPVEPEPDGVCACGASRVVRETVIQWIGETGY